MYKKLILISAMFLGTAFSENYDMAKENVVHDVDEGNKSEQIQNAVDELKSKFDAEFDQEKSVLNKLLNKSEYTKDDFFYDLIFTKKVHDGFQGLNLASIVNACDSGDNNTDNGDVLSCAVLRAISEYNPDFFNQECVLDRLISDKKNEFSFLSVYRLGLVDTLDEIFDILKDNGNKRLGDLVFDMISYCNSPYLKNEKREVYIGYLKRLLTKLKNLVGGKEFNKIIEEKRFGISCMVCVLQDDSGVLINLLKEVGYTFDKDTKYGCYGEEKNLFNMISKGRLAQNVLEVLYEINPDSNIESKNESLKPSKVQKMLNGLSASEQNELFQLLKGM